MVQYVSFDEIAVGRKAGVIPIEYPMLRNLIAPLIGALAGAAGFDIPVTVPYLIRFCGFGAFWGVFGV